MANFNFKFPFVMMAFLVQLMLNKIMSFVKKLHQLLINNKGVDNLTWIALLCVDPLLYYVPTVDSQNIALLLNYPLLITLWVLYLPLVAYRIYRCMISRKNRLIIISAETTLLVINHAVSLWLLIFRPAMEISSPLSVIIVFVVVGAYLLRVYAVFEWFARQIQGIFALWLLAAIIYIYGGYIFGSFWFYLAINKQIICWKNACTTLDGCHFSPPNFIFNLKEREILINSCSVNSKLGFLKDAFVSGIIYREGLWQRVFMCLLWGIQMICTFASAPRIYNSYNWNDELESAFVISVVIYAAVTICLFISSLGSTRKIKN